MTSDAQRIKELEELVGVLKPIYSKYFKMRMMDEPKLQLTWPNPSPTLVPAICRSKKT